MPVAPDLDAVKAYLGTDVSWSDEDIEAALVSETAAQYRVVRVPLDLDGFLDYPADLAEALCRRVAANLANRALPLGVQANMSEAAVQTTRVGGGDREVRRLEAPWRRLVVG